MALRPAPTGLWSFGLWRSITWNTKNLRGYTMTDLSKTSGTSPPRAAPEKQHEYNERYKAKRIAERGAAQWWAYCREVAERIAEGRYTHPCGTFLDFDFDDGLAPNFDFDEPMATCGHGCAPRIKGDA
jgi:hypothetical protein